MDSNSGWPTVGPETAPVGEHLTAPEDLSGHPQVTAATPVNPLAENPPWTAVDLLIAAFVLLLTVVVLQFVAMHISGVSAAELEKNPSAVILVPAMMLGYVVLLATMYVRVARSQGLQFWNMIAWRWPDGVWWLVCLAGGVALAVGLGFLSHLLPFPKSVPMERFFRDRRAAYLLMFMGVAVAPFAEEIIFRGFLYPVLDRGLQTLFMVRRQLINGGGWLLLAAGWGYLIHRLSEWHHLERGVALASSSLLAVLAFLVIGVWIFVRWSRGRPADTLLLSGLSLCVWGLMSRSVSERTFTSTTSGLLAAAFVLGATGAAGALSPTAAGRLGRVLAVLATSAAFAMVHGEQLGEAWGPLLLIFMVGMVLTITRVLTRSVAPGFLIHVAYNMALFAGLYLGSDHFRHLERISQ